jgi:alkaline phosphatase
MKIRSFVLVAIIGLASPACAQTPRPQGKAPAARVKNVIIMIADGAGFNHFAATDRYREGMPVETHRLSYPVALAVSTFPSGGSYDPDAAWRDPATLKKGATDSAAAATALSCGIKTRNGYLGVGPDGKPATHLMELAETLGKATGVVSTVPFSHATPAGFVVHDSERNDYSAIAEQMIQNSLTDVIIGCQHPEYDDNGKPREKPAFKYMDEPLWRSIQAGEAGSATDADHNGVQDDAWALVQDRAEFQRLAKGPAPKRLLGVPKVAATLQQRRRSVREKAVDEEPFETPLIQTVPTLSEMSLAALNVLDDDPDGFVLMIEGGAPDWASHNSESARMIEEMTDFNNAVDAVLLWVQEHSDWKETLLVVTADHETGFLTAKVEGMPNPSPAFAPVSRGKGKLPAMQWNSGKHTNSLVPFFARGAGSERFTQAATGRHPTGMPYLDNTSIPKVIRGLLIPGEGIAP